MLVCAASVWMPHTSETESQKTGLLQDPAYIQTLSSEYEVSPHRPVFILFMGMSVFPVSMPVNHFHGQCQVKRKEVIRLTGTRVTDSY